MSRSVLVGTAGLSAAAIAAFTLTVARRPTERDRAQRRLDVLLVLAAVAVQAAHFGEELATGFHERFPAALGLEPWPLTFFVAFNVAWLAIWIVSALALPARRRVALFPLWFLGIASAANGLAHPLLALAAGGYFPGLITAPFAGAAGIVLFRRLLAMTEGAGSATIGAS